MVKKFVFHKCIVYGVKSQNPNMSVISGRPNEHFGECRMHKDL